MHVLMAADGSKYGTASLVSACHILKPEERSVDLLCVAPKVDLKKGPLQERLNRRASRIAARVCSTLAEAGTAAAQMVHCGSAARVLLRLAQDYDVAVVGAKSHAGAGSPGLGPIASRLIEHANTSVLVAREGASESSLRILVPVDGSDGSLHALDQMGKLVDLASAEVTLMHVVENHWLQPVDDPDWAAGEDEKPGAEPAVDYEREFTDAAGQLLESARDRLPVRTAVNTLVYHGIPVDQILSEANTGEYDLLVLAATGEMDVKHRILGSVSGKVAWNAPCSVLLVHTGD